MLAIACSIGLTGCSSGLIPAAISNPASLTGNWQVSSTASAASRLPSLSGELTGTADAVTGILHPGPVSNSGNSCAAAATAIAVSGHANAKNLLTLTGGIGGGTLTITGTLAADGKSLTAASYNVSGGSCAFSAPAAATMQAYSSVTGNYAGSFSDPGGQVISITATLTQTPESDTDGNFQLSGTGTFPNNPCFSSPVTISNSQVTGGSFTLTYADPATQNSVTATGTFSSDAQTLTVTNWTLTGSCGPDTGTGSLTRQ
jgi:hypothetical protein